MGCSVRCGRHESPSLKSLWMVGCMSVICEVPISYSYFPVMFFTDPPSPPRWLEVINITKNTADLKWTVPERDGGSPITNYIVEKRDVRRKGWQTVDTTAKDTKYTVTPLTEGSLYVFRVAAENAVGQSDYCEIEDSVLARDTFSKLSMFTFRFSAAKLELKFSFS